jgi:hypothetical protein
MYKWFILAASCFAFVSASAQECGEPPVTSTEEVTVEEGQGTSDAGLAPSLSKGKDSKGGCGCGKPK